MSTLDTTIKSSIGDYRNAVNVKNTEVPDFDDEYTKEQLLYNFDLKDSDIYDSKEVAVPDKKTDRIWMMHPTQTLRVPPLTSS